MKLRWPLWQIVIAWMGLHAIGFFSLALGWLVPIGLMGGLTAYVFYGAFAQMVAYGVIAGKKARKAWIEQYKDTSGPIQPGASTSHSRALGYVIWILLPVIIYVPFFIIAIGEK